MKKLLLLLCTFLCSVGMWAEEATLSTMSTSGTIVEDIITFTTAANGSNNPQVSSEQLRLYANTSANMSTGVKGGSITITAAEGYAIQQVTLAIANDGNSNTTAGYQVDGTGSWVGSANNVVKNTNYSTGDNLGASTVEIANFGTTTRSNRIYITSITVKYSVKASTAFTVTFNAGANGTCSTSNLTETSAGVGVKLPSCSANTGYVFEGWATTNDATRADAGKASDTFHPSADCNLYAVYAPVYTVTLSDDNSTLTQTGANASVELPSREDVDGYTFLGWSTTNVSIETTTAPENVEVENYVPTTNITLYPVYSRFEGAPNQTVSVNVAKYAEAHDWTVLASGSATKETHCKYEIEINNDVTVTTNDNNVNGAVYADGWRIYQSYNGAVNVTTTAGSLVSVKFTYTNGNSGQLFYGEDQLTSNTAIEVEGTSAVFNVIRPNSSTTNGQVKITAIEVTYGSGVTYYLSTPIIVPTFASLDKLIDANLDENTVVNVTISDEVAMAMANPMTGAYMVSLKNSEVILAAPGSDLGWKNGATVSGTLENVTWDPYNYALTGETNFWSTLTYDYAGPSYDGTIDFMAASEDGYYTTFSNDEAVTIPYAIEVGDEYVYFTVYSVYADGNQIELQDLTEGLTYNGEIWLSENEGYLIKAEITSEEYNFTGSTVFSVGYTNVGYDLYGQDDDNALRPASAPMTGDYKFYKLAYGDWENKSGLGFYWGEEDGAAFEAKTGGAYLAVPASAIQAAVRGFAFNGGEATAIKTVNTTSKNTVHYNLAGQRVNANAKGIIVTNGKKHLVK